MEWYPSGVVLDLDILRGERLRPLKRAEFDQLVRTGAFEDERVELLRGWLVEMSPQGLEHSFAIQELENELAFLLHGRAKIRTQLPLAATDDSETEPDLAVVAFDAGRDAQPDTALLVIEVAVSSVRKDREIKARIYAEAGVIEYWVVDVDRSIVVRHLEPKDCVYARVTEHGREESLALQAFPDVVVSIDAILLAKPSGDPA